MRLLLVAVLLRRVVGDSFLVCLFVWLVSFLRLKHVYGSSIFVLAGCCRILCRIRCIGIRAGIV